MNEDLDYQRILNLHVYALSKGKSPPPKKKQIYLDNIIAQDSKAHIRPSTRGRVKSQLSFEPNYPPRISQGNLPVLAKSTSGIKREGNGNSDEKREQKDFSESGLRRELMNQGNNKGEIGKKKEKQYFGNFCVFFMWSLKDF